MQGERQVVITGIGVVSPIGIGIEAYWNSLCSGNSGIGPITEFDATGLPVSFGGELKNFDAKKHIKPRKSLKVMCREIQTACVAANLAAAEAGIDSFEFARERMGVVYGSEMLYGDLAEYADVYRKCAVDGEFEFDRFGTEFPHAMNPLWMLKYLPNMAACHVAISQDARGPNNTIVLGEASSLMAMIEATNTIRRGAADVMIAGGTGTRISITGMLYRGDSQLSHRSETPSEACRPYDLDRDGMVYGEGAAAFVLEEASFAKKRNAPILCHITGFGQTVDTKDGAQSKKDAIQNSLSITLRSAGVQADQISHINPNGLSTIDDDVVEAQAIHKLLGDVPVTAPQSYFGHVGAGSSAVELVASVLAITRKEVPRTLNYSKPDPSCPIKVVKESMSTEKPAAIKMSQSQTGQCVALAIEAPTP